MFYLNTNSMFECSRWYKPAPNVSINSLQGKVQLFIWIFFRSFLIAVMSMEQTHLSSMVILITYVGCQYGTIYINLHLCRPFEVVYIAVRKFNIVSVAVIFQS